MKSPSGPIWCSELTPTMLPAALALLLLFLAAWDAAFRRRTSRLTGTKVGHLAARPSDRLQVHLASWTWFAALLYALAGVFNANPGTPSHLPLLCILIGALVGWVIVVGGRFASRHLTFPRYLHWTLEPYHGLALWLFWLWGPVRKLKASFQLRASAGRSEREATVSGSTTSESGPPSAGELRQGVVDLAAISVGELMIPRSQVIALEGGVTAREAVAKVRATPHSIYPVYGESVDQPLGVVRMIDLAGTESPDRPVRELATQVPIVPETMRGLILLRRLSRAKMPAALVVDEFGGMAGFVTVEDLIEVLVGELEGEHEVVRKRILPLGEGRYRVEGTCRVDEFNEQVAPILPEGEYETVAGLYLDRTGRIPQQGEELELPGVTLRVLERTERRILWLEVEVLAAAEVPAQG